MGGLKKPRAALLIIHGIGEQAPFQTLGHFTQGLVRHVLAKRGRLNLEPGIVEIAGETEEVIRVDTGHSELPFEHLDLYEYYWAGKVQGRINAAQAFIWLLRTGLTPLNFRRQLPMMLEHHSRRHTLRVVLREVWLALLLLLLVLSLALMAVIVLTQGRDLVGALTSAAQIFVRELKSALGERSFWVVLRQTSLIALFGSLFIIGAYLLFSLGLALWQSWRIAQRHQGLGLKKVWRGLYAGRLGDWLPWSLLIIVLIIVIEAVLYFRVRQDLGALYGALGVLLAAEGVRWTLLLLALASYGRWLLVTYVGDIVLYVTSDQTSAHYRTRKEIKDEASLRLRAMLNRQTGTADAYDAVYLAGHSLGSVIAYDVLNDLSQRQRAGQRVALDKLKGFLTFGSPLDKVYYFFRQRVDEDEAVRAQLLSFIHATKRYASERDDGPYAFEPYEVPLQKLYWVNIYSHADLISGFLDYYDVPEKQQHAMSYLNPFTAHGDYWRDPDFYAHVADWLQSDRAQT